MQAIDFQQAIALGIGEAAANAWFGDALIHETRGRGVEISFRDCSARDWARQYIDQIKSALSRAGYEFSGVRLSYPGEVRRASLYETASGPERAEADLALSIWRDGTPLVAALAEAKAQADGEVF